MHFQTLVFAGVIVFLVIVFILIALWLNKDALVLDLIKVILGFAGGWGASLAWSNRKQSNGD
jgi:Na+/glutamate symporter